MVSTFREKWGRETFQEKCTFVFAFNACFSKNRCCSCKYSVFLIVLTCSSGFWLIYDSERSWNYYSTSKSKFWKQDVQFWYLHHPAISNSLIHLDEPGDKDQCGPIWTLLGPDGPIRCLDSTKLRQSFDKTSTKFCRNFVGQRSERQNFDKVSTKLCRFFVSKCFFKVSMS